MNLECVTFGLKGRVGGHLFLVGRNLSHGGCGLLMTPGEADSIVIDDELAELFGDAPFLSGWNFEQETHSPHGSRAGTDPSAGEELQENQDDEVSQSFLPDSALNSAVVPQPFWNGMIAASYSRYRATDASLQLPWEVGACADIFQVDRSPRLPNIQPFCQPVPSGVTSEAAIEHDRVSFALHTGVCYIHAVSDTRDLTWIILKRNAKSWSWLVGSGWTCFPLIGKLQMWACLYVKASVRIPVARRQWRP